MSGDALGVIESAVPAAPSLPAVPRPVTPAEARPAAPVQPSVNETQAAGPQPPTVETPDAQPIALAEQPAEPTTAEMPAEQPGQTVEQAAPGPSGEAVPSFVGEQPATAADLVGAIDDSEQAGVASHAELSAVHSLETGTGVSPEADQVIDGGPAQQTLPSQATNPETPSITPKQEALLAATKTLEDAKRAWEEAGRPETGPVFDTYRSAKFGYETADRIRAQELSESYARDLLESQTDLVYVGPFQVRKADSGEVIKFFADINKRLGIDTSYPGSGFEFILGDALVQAAREAASLTKGEGYSSAAESANAKMYQLLAMLQEATQGDTIDGQKFDGSLADFILKAGLIVGKVIGKMVLDFLTRAEEQTTDTTQQNAQPTPAGPGQAPTAPAEAVQPVTSPAAEAAAPVSPGPTTPSATS